MKNNFTVDLFGKNHYKYHMPGATYHYQDESFFKMEPESVRLARRKRRKNRIGFTSQGGKRTKGHHSKNVDASRVAKLRCVSDEPNAHRKIFKCRECFEIQAFDISEVNNGSWVNQCACNTGDAGWRNNNILLADLIRDGRGIVEL